MKNKETWKFAHCHCGKMWWWSGWIMLAFSILAMLPLMDKDLTIIETSSLIIIGAQTIVLVLPIILTERALQKNFDKNGKFKKK